MAAFIVVKDCTRMFKIVAKRKTIVYCRRASEPDTNITYLLVDHLAMNGTLIDLK